MLLIKSQLIKKLLAFYFTNPQAKKYLRELARILDVDPGNLSKELNKLEKEGLFKFENRGGQKVFYLNKDYPLFEEYKNIILKTEGVVGSLKQVLSSFEKIDRVFIFGSFAQNNQRPDSDIDLLIIGEVDFSKINSALNELEKKLGREINQVVYSPQEFNKKKNKTPFLKDIFKNKTINLINQNGKNKNPQKEVI